MADADPVRCPKCRSLNWRDIPNTADRVRTRFSCDRCSYTITIGACRSCGARQRQSIQGIDRDLKGPRRPVYRLRCGGCGRKIGFVIGR